MMKFVRNMKSTFMKMFANQQEMDAHKWKIEEYFKEGWFYVKNASKWDINVRWKFVRCAIADIIYDTLRKIIETNDKSPWAIIAFYYCEDLLRSGERWPDYLEKQVPYHWKRNFPILKRFYFKNASWYRSQYSVTRDLHILLRACAVHLGLDPSIRPSLPLLKYSPKTWSWARALNGKWSCYKFWKWLLPPKKQFVQDLHKFRESSLKQITKQRNDATKNNK